MKIPIQNIYYLLCYSWNCLEERDLVRVKPIASTELVDLFSQVLIKGISYLRKRGLDRGYIQFAEDTSTLRGKINFNESLKRNLLSLAKTHCEFDTMSYDILHNRILKATIQNLVKVKELDSELKYRLKEILRLFSEINTLTLTSIVFRRVQLNRNNAFYRFLINVCELIFENLLVSEDTGETRFRDFLRDDKTMNVLFEKFVRNFFKREQNVFNVKPTQIDWNRRVLDEVAETFLPKMLTDITLSEQHRMIIIDTKFYKNPLVTHYLTGKKRVHESHLYQIFAYLKNVEDIDEVSRHCEGILLYPTVDQDFDLKYELGGHPVKVCTINLNQNWHNIHHDLMTLIA